MHKRLALVIVLFLSGAVPAFAANTTGHAWSESVGWFDFSGATVSDSALSGHAYNDNTGWLVLSGVTNTDGQLGGYAWSESVGYFDFSGVTIESGDFGGYAYNDNTGWLSFESGTNVSTTWEEAVDPGLQPDSNNDTSYGSRSGSSGQKKRDLKGNVKIDAPASLPPPVVTGDSHAYATILSSEADMELGSIREEVRILQRFLNAQGFTVNTDPTGPGSAGNETNYFGSLTREALARFQAARGIAPAAGYFGPITRGVIRSLFTNQYFI